MELNEDTVTAEVYAITKSGIAYVKISMFGLYLNSITVRVSPNFPERGLWVQLPKFRGEKGYATPICPIERNPNGGLWRLIESKAREAAQLAFDSSDSDIDTSSETSADVVLTDLPEDLDIEAIFDDMEKHL